MKHILMIVYNFPPSTAAGMYRSLRFSKYLGKLGWQVSVLTIQSDAGSSSSGQAVPEHIAIYRTPVFQILPFLIRLRGWFLGSKKSGHGHPMMEDGGSGSSNQRGIWQHMKDTVSLLFTFPDAAIGWVPSAVFKGLQVIKKARVDMIYTSGPPHSSHLIGLILKKLAGKRWVADFRDPWSRKPWVEEHENRSWRRHGIEFLEKRVVLAADRVILNTEGLREDFSTCYSHLDRGKFSWIPNGYDQDDFKGLPSRPIETRFTITHTGSLYRKRNPVVLFEAVSQLIEEGVIKPHEIQLQFVGSVSLGNVSLRSVSNELGLNGVVSLIPPLPHRESLSILFSSHVLLAIQPDTDVQIPGKIFEYLYAGKPILALTQAGMTADFVQKNHLGIVANPDQIQEVREAVRLLHSQYKEGIDPQSKRDEVLSRYDACNLAKELDVVLNHCLTESNQDQPS